MKRTVLAVVLALALGVVLAFALGLFRGSDESQIRSTLTRLASTVSVGEGDSNIVFRVRRIDRDFADLFDDDVRVSFPDLPYAPNGRAELANIAADLPTVWSRADASFDSVTVKLDDAHATATVQTTARLVDLTPENWATDSSTGYGGTAWLGRASFRTRRSSAS